MWYGSGTLNVAANGTNATGTGTQFLGNVRVGDGIAIQGSASLHEVTGVTSNTQLTFSPPYAGTAGSGKAYRAVPVLGYDKDLSDAFNQLRLQFGEQLSSLQPWATAPTQDAAQTALGMSASGKTVATGTPAQGRNALGLGSAALRSVVETDTDDTSGRVLVSGSFGLGSGTGALPSSGPGSRFLRGTPLSIGVEAPPGFSPNVASGGIRIGTSSSVRFWEILGTGQPGRDHLVAIRGVDADFNGVWHVLYNTGNTTVDSNGFIKAASPIINLFSDRITSNERAEGAEFDRLDTGHYQLTGTNGLRLDDGWYIETPHDKNGNKYFNVEWEQDHTPETDAGILDEPADVTLTIRCYERVWNPQTGQYDNGAPVDIPDGRWIDLRLNEVRVDEPETDEPEAEQPQQPVEPTGPIIPDVVTMAQAKLALHYAGLLQLVEDAISTLPEAERTTALIEWHHRQTLERSHPLVAQVAAALELTEQRLDELFMDAAGR